MNIQECTDAIRTKVGDNSGLNAVLKFDCGDDGKIVTGFMGGKFKVSGDMSIAMKLQRVI